MICPKLVDNATGVIPISGAKNPKKAEQNLGAANWRLTEQELAKVEGVFKKMGIDTS